MQENTQTKKTTNKGDPCSDETTNIFGCFGWRLQCRQPCTSERCRAIFSGCYRGLRGTPVRSGLGWPHVGGVANAKTTTVARGNGQSQQNKPNHFQPGTA